MHELLCERTTSRTPRSHLEHGERTFLSDSGEVNAVVWNLMKNSLYLENDGVLNIHKPGVGSSGVKSRTPVDVLLMKSS